MKKLKYLQKIIFILLLIIIINFYIIIIIFKKLHISYKYLTKKEINKIDLFTNFGKMKTNIEYDDDFYQLPEVKEQIKRKNISYIETIAPGDGCGNIGNALILLNNLINICENIKCKNVIAPGENLNKIIKNPIFYKEKNIIIWPNLYKDKINVDIQIKAYILFYFKYKNKKIYNRLKIIREEVVANIPKFKNNPDDLVINIRSGDVFVNQINKNYGQPPLCFYQKK